MTNFVYDTITRSGTIKQLEIRLDFHQISHVWPIQFHGDVGDDEINRFIRQHLRS